MYNKFYEKIPDHEHNRAMLADIQKAGEQYLGTPIASLAYSKFRIFHETGSRIEYEADYIAHRRRLNVFAALALSSDDKKWLDGLEDILWAICDEFTWAFPAHLSKEENTAIQCVTKLDLFAAETGFALSEIYYLLKRRLSSLVLDRIQYEVRRRMIDPYFANDLKWYKNNWSSVCAGSVGVAIMYLGSKEELARVKNRLIASMDCFLQSYHDDGCCLEGPLYWAYGFGYFCYFSKLLRDFTNGEVDLFANDKVKRIAEFGQKAYLADNIVLPFADAPHNINFNIGLAHFLANQYDTVSVPDETYEARFDDDIRYRFADFIRNFFWYDPTLKKADAAKNAYDVMKDAQWYIKKGTDMVFAAKGGTNAEPHNHNDIGGFVLLSHKKFIIDDLGWPEYVGGYFGEKRYEGVCASSRGHSVPIINGTFQVPGEECAALLLSESDTSFCLDITKAYRLEILRKVVRKFQITNDAITLSDGFHGKIETVTERFVTRIKPEIKGNTVLVDHMKIECDTPARICVSAETFEPRLSVCKMDMKAVETAYLIDFKIDSTTDDFIVNFQIEPA